MKRRVSNFKDIFKDMFFLGFPKFWNQEGMCFLENDYHLMLLAKNNDVSVISQTGSNIKGK